MDLKVKIKKIGDEKVILETDDKKEIVWPKNKLPKDIEENMILDLSIGFQERAKKILNEILDIKK